MSVISMVPLLLTSQTLSRDLRVRSNSTGDAPLGAAFNRACTWMKRPVAAGLAPFATGTKGRLLRLASTLSARVLTTTVVPVGRDWVQLTWDQT